MSTIGKKCKYFAVVYDSPCLTPGGTRAVDAFGMGLSGLGSLVSVPQ
jgi:hypothetical protein